jgi:Uma2 family endonuclease
MVALQDRYPKFTPAEYLAWEEKQELRYEYVKGEVYAMTGGSVNHGRIGGNFYYMLRSHLRGKDCLVLNSDVKVQIENSSNYVYPDVSVTCHPADLQATKSVDRPCLIVEVLSHGTEAYDRGNKFNNLYRNLSSLREYVLVSSEEIAISLYRKTERERWEIVSYRGGNVVELESVSFTFQIEDLFEGIILDRENPFYVAAHDS